MKKHLHVAVGVIQNKDGKILIAKRPESAHQGGLWEFPGGKVDANETLEQALFRELKEELAIDIHQSEPLIQIRHHYPDKSVFLDVHKITQFRGEPKGNEGQPVQWVNPAELDNFEFPAANRPIIKAIKLPRQMAITGAHNSLEDFECKLIGLINAEIKLIQLRINNFSMLSHKPYFQFAYDLSRQQNIQLQLNCDINEFLSIPASPCLGLHLNSLGLFTCNERPVSEETLLGASCHSLEELQQAEKIGVDYVLLSPVNFTKSHPGTPILGWEKFQQMIEAVNLPVFGLGGMHACDLPQAIQAGAQGIAGISEWWSQESCNLSSEKSSK